MSRTLGRNRLPAAVEPLAVELRKQGAYTVLFQHAVAEHFGMTLTELVCGNLLDMFGAMPAGRLAELTGLTTGAITGVVDRMEAAGFVRRKSDPDDRRRVIVEPTRQRDAEFDRLFAGLGRGLGQLLGELNPTQLATIHAFSVRLNELLLAESTRMREDTSRPARTRRSRT
jgi:DNA-binding MarR family transcriptional regulator